MVGQAHNNVNGDALQNNNNRQHGNRFNFLNGIRNWAQHVQNRLAGRLNPQTNHRENRAHSQQALDPNRLGEIDNNNAPERVGQQASNIEREYSPEEIAELVASLQVKDAGDTCNQKEKIYLAKYFVDKVKDYFPSLGKADWDRASLDDVFFDRQIKPMLETLLKEHRGLEGEESKAICNDVQFVLDNFYEVHQATNRDLTIAFLWNTVVDNREAVEQTLSLDKIYMLHSITLDSAITKTCSRAEAFKEFLLEHSAECSQEGWDLKTMIKNYPAELSLLKSGTGIEVVEGKVEGVPERYLLLEGNGRVAALRLGFQMAQNALQADGRALKPPLVKVTSYIAPSNVNQSTTEAIHTIMDKTRELNTQGYKRKDTILF